MNTATIALPQQAQTPYFAALAAAASAAWKALFATQPDAAEVFLAQAESHDDLAIRQREVERSEAHALAMSWVV